MSMPDFTHMLRYRNYVSRRAEDDMIEYAKAAYIEGVIDLEKFEDAIDDIFAGDGWDCLSFAVPQMGGLPPAIK